MLQKGSLQRGDRSRCFTSRYSCMKWYGGPRLLLLLFFFFYRLRVLVSDVGLETAYNITRDGFT